LKMRVKKLGACKCKRLKMPPMKKILARTLQNMPVLCDVIHRLLFQYSSY
jgi:hypothetical protein